MRQERPNRTLLTSSLHSPAIINKVIQTKVTSRKRGLLRENQDSLGEQEFDLILCHLMIEMVADANALLREMCKILAPGGILSVLDVNRYSQVFLEAIINKNLADGCDVVGAKEFYHRWVDRVIPRFSAEEIIEQLEPNGCALAGQYGVSCINHWLPNEPKSDPEYVAQLLKLEHRLSDTYPYYLLARFYQVIAEKK